jgi:hypothetical protein
VQDRWTRSARLAILVSVLIRRIGGEWRASRQTAYLNESELQALLAGSPDLIPGTNEGLAIVREFPVQTGSIDLVGVSPSGDVVLCECKLERNEEARRKVVGQILSYAGSLWRMPLEEFFQRFESRSERPLIEAVSQPALDSEWGEEAWRFFGFGATRCGCLSACRGGRRDLAKSSGARSRC